MICSGKNGWAGFSHSVFLRLPSWRTYPSLWTGFAGDSQGFIGFSMQANGANAFAIGEWVTRFRRSIS